MLRDFLTQPFVLVYDDNEGGDDGGGDGGDGAGGQKKGGDDGKLSMTQDQLNKMMADNRRKITQQNEKLVAEINGLKDQASMTATERSELEERVEKLQELTMSHEEITKRNTKKASQAHQKELDNLTNERDHWRSNYTNERVSRSLQDAAIEAKATVPEQIVSLLGPQTQLSEVLGEDGKPTGAYQPLIKFVDVDDDGKPTTLSLSPVDAMKRMKELPDRFGNLFMNPGAGGFGADNGSGGKGGKKTTIDAIKDPAAYMKWRKENPGVDPTSLLKG
jgi:hypothetical protein